MSILNFFDELVDKFEILRWSESERKNLFRVLLEIYSSDEVFSNDEKIDFKRRAMGLNINTEEVEKLDFQKALFELNLDLKKIELLNFWIASSLFADNDYDKKEQEFINKIITKYQLDGQKLKAVIKKIRDQKIDIAIRQWYSEIECLF